MHKLSESQIEDCICLCSEKLYFYCKKHNIHYTVTGVSGGLDSAVTFGLAQKASQLAQKDDYKLFHVGLMLPCHTDASHMDRANEVIQVFHGEKMQVNLDGVFDHIETQMLDSMNSEIQRILEKTQGKLFTKNDEKVAKGNIKARLRMMLGTYHTARMLNGLVLSTDNYSEFLMGFWTICGDVGDFGMIQNIYKGLELYDIARALGVPDSVINAMPDDGLGITSGGDEGQLGVDYQTLDSIMIELKKQGFDPDKDDVLPEDVLNSFDVSKEKVVALWERSVRTRYKRKGEVRLGRGEIGLPIR